MICVEPSGVITGFCFAPASTADQPLVETFFALGGYPNSSVPCVGSLSFAPYVADKGFEEAENHRRWLEEYGAELIHPPRGNSRKPWSRRLRKWIAGIRQVLESVYDKLFNMFGLW